MSSRSQHLYEFGPFRLDTAEQLLLRDGKPVPLTPKAFEMLVALVERSGHLVEKEELMKVVWADAFVEESNLTNNVSALRKLLGQGQGGENYIETVPKRGYRFTAAVKELTPEALVIQKRTLTRIVTEETEETSESVAVAAKAVSITQQAPLITRPQRSSRSLLLIALIVVGAATAFAIYWFTRVRNRSVAVQPFNLIDVSRVTTSGEVTHSAISHNGKYVANVVKHLDGNSLWLKHVGVPSNVRLAGPAMTEYISVTFAPDANAIYYIALDHDKGVSTLYSVPTLGGPSTKVADDIYPVVFSPDGKQIAFFRMHQGESTLVVADVDGSNQRVVATRHNPELFEMEWNAPAWAPDGRTIACPIRLSDARGYFETIIAVNPTDGSQALLTSARWSLVGQSVWLPDSSGLLLTAVESEGSPMQVWHISLPGGVATRVTHDLNDYHDLSLTSEANHLVAVQVQAISNIWVASGSDGQDARQISSEIGSLEVLAWTTDGRIVYRSSAGGNGADIWIMNADGSNAKQLTVGARASRGLAVTPNGRHIVFVSDRAGQFNLWRVDTDGGNLRQLTARDGEFYPHCCADGQWVIFQSGFIDPRLWKVHIEGGEPSQLTRTRATRPAVSPDGQMIAYSYLDLDLKPSRWGIGIVSTEGERLSRFDFPPTVVYRAVRWSPDSKSIAFVNSPNDRSDIWLQPLDGSAPKQLTNFKAEQILAFDWSPDGRSLAFVSNVETSDVVLIAQKQ